MSDPGAGYGLSKNQILHNIARVAQAKAQMTKKADDWDAAAEAWSKVEGKKEMEDYCRRMSKMIRGLAEGQ